jgi:hypothetical protein
MAMTGSRHQATSAAAISPVSDVRLVPAGDRQRHPTGDGDCLPTGGPAPAARRHACEPLGYAHVALYVGENKREPAAGWFGPERSEEEGCADA